MPVTRRPPSSGAPLKRTDNRMLTHNLQIRVRRPPSQPSDLELIEAPGPTLTNGAFLARTLWLALDPFVCAPDAAAHDAVKPGDLVPAHGVGEVIESRHEVFGVGSLVVDRKSTRLNSSHGYISYAVFCLKKKKIKKHTRSTHRGLTRPLLTTHATASVLSCRTLVIATLRHGTQSRISSAIRYSLSITPL